MYNRIIVSLANDFGSSAFLFRTSKIKSAAQALEIRRNLDIGFNGLAGQTGADETHVVQILEVTGEPKGVILDTIQLAALAATVDVDAV